MGTPLSGSPRLQQRTLPTRACTWIWIELGLSAFRWLRSNRVDTLEENVVYFNSRCCFIFPSVVYALDVVAMRREQLEHWMSRSCMYTYVYKAYSAYWLTPQLINLGLAVDYRHCVVHKAHVPREAVQ